MERIAYSRRREDLFSPERGRPVFAPGAAPDAVTLAVEAARLAYFRHEDPGPREALEQALGCVGFKQFEYFEGRDAPESAQSLAGNAMSMLRKAARAVDPDMHLFKNPSDSQGFAAYDPEERLALLAFRGTQSDTLRDLLINAQFRMVKAAGWGEARLHQGFVRAASAIWPAVEEWLSQSAAQRLLVCGHSLGAAVATLIAWRARHLGFATRLVTIGSPRVGDERFAASFDASGIDALRIVDGLDIVTRVPPSSLGFDYRHVGQRCVFIDREANRIEDPTPEQVDGNVSLAQVGNFFKGRLPTELTDHAPINYLRAYWP